MGWDSELTVDGYLFGQWRKQAPSLPTLLFKATDLEIIPATGDDEDDPGRDTVVWATSAEEALANLRSSGFAWDHLVGDYTQCRDFSLKLAYIQGRLGVRLGMPEYKKYMAKVDAHAPADDLRVLAESVIAEGKALERVSAEKNFEHDLRTPLSDALFFDAPTEDRYVNKPDELPDCVGYVQARALDYFVRSQRSAPLVGWAFSFVALLHHVSPDARVEFDVSGGLGDHPDKMPDEYAEQFWSAARADLTAEARFYGSVFVALASATTDVAQAAQYGRLEAMLAAATEKKLSKARRGRCLEELVATLLELPNTQLSVLEKRLRHADEELDLVLRNDLDVPFWKSFNSPIVIIECKNWSSPVGITELRILETKMRDRHKLCSVGVFVSLGGFSQPFLQRACKLHGQGLTVFLVDARAVQEIILRKQTLPQWLCDDGLRQVL